MTISGVLNENILVNIFVDDPKSISSFHTLKKQFFKSISAQVCFNSASVIAVCSFEQITKYKDDFRPLLLLHDVCTQVSILGK